jgi:hypothetical protein
METIQEGKWYEEKLGYAIVKNYHITTSPVLSDTFFLIYKVMSSFFVLTVIIMSIGYDWEMGFWFAYFTHWSYLILVMYFLTSTYLIIKNFTYRNVNPVFNINENDELIFVQQKASFIEIFVTALYCVGFCFHVIVPIVYWTSLRDGSYSFLNISQHILDFGIFLIDFFLNRMLFMWGYFLVAFFLSVLAGVWCFCFPMLFPERKAPYWFLDYKNPHELIYMMGIVLVAFFSWWFLTIMHQAKSNLCSRYSRYTLLSIE